jgi:hypothetical protein
MPCGIESLGTQRRHSNERQQAGHADRSIAGAFGLVTICRTAVTRYYTVRLAL